MLKTPNWWFSDKNTDSIVKIIIRIRAGSEIIL